MKNGYSVVRVKIGKTNRRQLDLLDGARRRTDYLGKDGMRAKKGQTDRRYRRKGYLRLVFPDRAMARAYMRRVERLGEPAIKLRLMKNPNPYPFH